MKWLVVIGVGILIAGLLGVLFLLPEQWNGLTLLVTLGWIVVLRLMWKKSLLER